MFNERIHARQWFNTLIPRWPTAGHVAFHLVTHDCTRGLSTRYRTVDSMID